MLCQSCVLACQEHFLDTAEPDKASGIKPVSRLEVGFSRGTPWIWKCQHCVSAPCVEACISGSMHYEEDGIGVIHDSDACVGCGSCMMVCPFGAIRFDEIDERGIKCNLCRDCEIPPCVSACQSGALVYEDARDFDKKKLTNFVKKNEVKCA